MSLGKIGGAMALCLSALGSGLGIMAAGQAAVGAWKKCFAQSKPAPFTLVVFVGAPITQTFYGMIVMMKLITLAKAGTPFPPLLVWGIFGGLAIGLSALVQGRIAAAASDAQAETGQGFTNYLMALGIIESVAIFVMVFILVFA
ncbi:MAG: V-type ATP synthase subunit K [Lentisphaerae bacterium]|nr:V-type ATP synthase subunit K [Lentisphaerota bacterium]